MKQPDRVAEALLRIRARYADEDPDALSEIERRIAATAGREDLITYTDLVRGIVFRLPTVNGGEPFEINEWTSLHRTIIGDFLGQVNVRSYMDHGFLASALVVDKAEQKPSTVFFREVKALLSPGRATELGVLEFWIEQVKRAYAFHAVQKL